MRFDQLIQAVPAAGLRRPASELVTGIEFDSREVVPGACFVCRRGLQDDGHAYVPAALEAGAVAIVAERALSVPAGIGLAVVPDGRLALAALARRFWSNPDEDLGLIGVTGTDGKTTTTRLIAWMLDRVGIACGEISTVAVRVGGKERPKRSRLTTPEAPRLARLLREIVDAGAPWAALEVASHALELARVDGLAFDRAVITNVTHEHLDVHGSLAGYRRAKRRLLDLLDAAPPSVRRPIAILNADDPVVAGFAPQVRSEVMTFGQAPDADVRYRFRRGPGGGLWVGGGSPWGDWEARTALLGAWNSANIAAALTCLGTITGDVGAGAKALAGFPPVRGRMQRIDRGQPFLLIVDFAHTPAALEACLAEVRSWTDGRVIAVFGSAGQQDRAKRRMLGRAAALRADHVVVTDEDPRGEDPESIAAEIVAGAGAQDPGLPVEVVLDRRAAIRRAIELARPGDTIVAAGKGHESTIEYADRELPWDEVAVAREELGAAGFDG